MSVTINYLISDRELMFIAKGSRYMIVKGNSKFDDICQILRKKRHTQKDVDKLISLVDDRKNFNNYIDGVISASDGQLSYKNTVIPKEFYGLLRNMMDDDFHISIFTRFLDKLYSRSRSESSYQYLSEHSFSITPDGNIVLKFYASSRIEAGVVTALLTAPRHDIQNMGYVHLIKCDPSCRFNLDNPIQVRDAEIIDYICMPCEPDRRKQLFRQTVIIDDNYDDIYQIYTGDTL